jgi:uncharacterized delta-60 repeat protein
MKQSITYTLLYFILQFTTPISAQIDTAWSRVYEAGAWDELHAVATDPSGNIYVTGSSYVWGIGSDIITMKYASNGSLEWVKRLTFSSSGFEQGKNIAYHNGGIYVSGFSSAGGSTSLGQFFLIKYSTSGDSIWSYLDSNTSEGEPMAMHFDSEDNIILAGYNGSTDSDFITMKIDTAGNQIWMSTFNSENSGGANKIWDMCLDVNDNIYVTGISDVYLVSTLDITTIKYNTHGDSLWVRRFNGPANYHDAGRKIKYHSSGYLYVGGSVSDNAAPNFSDFALLKYDTSGTLIWDRLFNNTFNASDNFKDMAVDSLGAIYLVGTGSKSGDFTKNYFELVKYAPTGDTIWTRNFDLPNADEVIQLVIDESSNLFITGMTINNSNGGYNGLTCKFDSSGNLTWYDEYNGPLNNEDQFYALTLDSENDLITVGRTKNDTTTMDFVTVKYKNSISGMHHVKIADSYFNLSCYPNPANESVYLSYYLTRNDAPYLRIFDLLGNEIYAAQLGKQVSGVHTIQVNANKFMNGIYVCELSHAGRSAQTKMIVIK